MEQPWGEATFNVILNGVHDVVYDVTVGGLLGITNQNTVGFIAFWGRNLARKSITVGFNFKRAYFLKMR